MKIMIDIDENVFTRLFDNGIQDNEIAVDDVCEMARALRLGTPLPEHHGRLINYECVVDAIDDWINTEEYSYTNATDYLRNRVKDVPTIIERSDSE